MKTSNLCINLKTLYNPPSNEMFYMTSAVPVWKPFTGLLTQIDAGATGTLWGIYGGAFKLNDNRSNWIRLEDGGNNLKHISAGGGGVWVIGRNNKIFYRQGELTVFS